MVLNATSNNISAISWLSVLLVEETGVPGKNHQPVAEKLYHIMWTIRSKYEDVILENITIYNVVLVSFIKPRDEEQQ